jgi:hypothetical protein
VGKSEGQCSDQALPTKCGKNIAVACKANNRQTQREAAGEPDQRKKSPPGRCSRLDFTAVGRDINILSRLELLCKDVGRPLLMTDAFAMEVEATAAVILVRDPTGKWAGDPLEARRFAMRLCDAHDPGKVKDVTASAVT